MHANKDATLARMRRIEGQVRGVAKMIEEDRYCVDILTQLDAIRSALKAVEGLILKDHANHCVAEAVASGDEAAQRQKFEELIGILQKR